MKHYIPAIAALACLVLAPAPAGANEDPCTLSEPNLIENGGFEQPIVPGSWAIFKPDEVEGWSFAWTDAVTDCSGSCLKPDPANLEIHRGSVAGSGPYCGAQKAELDTDWNGPGGNEHCWCSPEQGNIRLEQDVPTCPGETYTIRYAWKPRTDQPGRLSSMDVYWNGMWLANHQGTGGPDWVVSSFEVTGADSGSSVLAFEEVGTADSFGMFLDHVVVTGPECPPCTTALIADGGSPETEVLVGYVAIEKDPDLGTCPDGQWAVTYKTHGTWVLDEIHFDLDCDPSGIPQTGKRRPWGNPKVGKFEYQPEDVSGNMHTFCVDPVCCELEEENEAEICSTTYAAHSVVIDTADKTEFDLVSGEDPAYVTRRRTGNEAGFTTFEEPAEAVPACTHSGWGTPVAGASWIWETCRVCPDDLGSYNCFPGCKVYPPEDLTSCDESVYGSVVTLEASVDIPGPVDWADFKITCDNAYELYVNGDRIGGAQIPGEPGAGPGTCNNPDWTLSNLKEPCVSVDGWQDTETYNLDLEKGINTLTIDAGNEYFRAGDRNNGKDGTNGSNPGACIYKLSGEYLREETAWGYGTPFNDRNWAMFFECECECP